MNGSGSLEDQKNSPWSKKELISTPQIEPRKSSAFLSPSYLAGTTRQGEQKDSLHAPTFLHNNLFTHVPSVSPQKSSFSSSSGSPRAEPRVLPVVQKSKVTAQETFLSPSYLAGTTRHGEQKGSLHAPIFLHNNLFTHVPSVSPRKSSFSSSSGLPVVQKSKVTAQETENGVGIGGNDALLQLRAKNLSHHYGAIAQVKENNDDAVSNSRLTAKNLSLGDKIDEITAQMKDNKETEIREENQIKPLPFGVREWERTKMRPKEKKSPALVNHESSRTSSSTTESNDMQKEARPSMTQKPRRRFTSD